MTDSCKFPKWQLVAYDDGSLKSKRRTDTEAHLKQCTACRQWIADVRAVDQILLHDVRDRDEDFLRERRRVLERVAADDARSRHGRWRRNWIRIAAVIVVAVLAVLSIIRSDSIVIAGSSFSRWLSNDRFVGRVYPGAFTKLTPTPVLIPIGVPGSLPFNLVRVVASPSQDTPGNDRMFRNSEGLTILVGADEHARSLIVQPEDPADALIVGVSGREVLLTFAQTEAGRAVIEIDWITGDTRHVILILRQPENGVTTEMAQALAMAFIGEDGQSPEQ